MTPDDPTNLYLTFYWLPFVIILQIEILSWALNGRHRDNPDLVLGSSFIYSNKDIISKLVAVNSPIFRKTEVEK